MKPASRPSTKFQLTTGGAHAKRGFKYQDTVVLELLITYFEEHGPSIRVRPEGLDDLELSWTASDGTTHNRFVQVKKPREDTTGYPTGRTWTLADMTSELLPDTFRRLNGNTWDQYWILGDDLADDARGLFSGRGRAATHELESYWTTVHRLAKQHIMTAIRPLLNERRRIARWLPSSKPPDNPREAIALLVRDFGTLLQPHVSTEVINQYHRSLFDIHTVLPGVLSRIEIFPKYGAEDDVVARVEQTLVERYNLHPEVVHTVLFRNLRGFVNDVSAIPGRTFSGEEFEIELRAVWPTMMPVRSPPRIDSTDLRRGALARRQVLSPAQTVEVIGISGSGKTTLAAEVCEQFRIAHPGRPVFYLEIDSNTELRDVLVGIAFRLRRYGHTDVFYFASRHAAEITAHDFVLADLARGIADFDKELLLVLDLVHGKCNDKFASDLRYLLGKLVNATCRLVIFGQESALRELTILERRSCRARSIGMPGFTFEEFVALVGQNHTDLDRRVLGDVFNALTAGRSAGLYGQLARTVANASSLDEMVEISRSAPDQLLQRSEREKFARLSGSARPAAERIACFALAFGRDEAEAVFPDVNVELAIVELLEVGLLREIGDDRVEMHETVRAGIEGAISVATRMEAHASLARHYRLTGRLSAEVFHLEKAGARGQAGDRAKEAFLQGNSWAQLYSYVTEQELVMANEVIDVVNSTQAIDGIYLLPEVLSKLGTERHAERLLEMMRTQIVRFGQDFNWSIAVAAAFLSLAPKRGKELYQVLLFAACSDDRRRNAISAVIFASRKRRTVGARDLIGLFDDLPTNMRVSFLPALFANGSRDCLKRAFEMMERHSGLDRGELAPSQEFAFLQVEGRADVVEFLAALPQVPDAQMLLKQSPLLGRLGPYIWKNRKQFEGHCIAILTSDEAGESVQRGAIRVLALSGNAELCNLCDEIASRTENPLHGFAALAPCLAPGLVDVSRYERRVLNTDKPFASRLSALRVLACADANVDTLYARWRAADGASFDDRWKSLLLMFAVEHPFSQAISMLEERLWGCDDDQSRLFAGVVKVLGTLAGEQATEMLKRAIGHPNATVRLAAALGLQEKRSTACFSGLRMQLASEREEVVRLALAPAICGAGPTDVGDLRAADHQDEGVMLWQCILAGRTRDEAFAEELVRIANNESFNWQLRRAAISAAGHLPYELALERMIQAARVRSTLADGHIGLYAHSFLSHLLGFDVSYLLKKFEGGRDGFAKFVGELCDDGAKDLLDKGNLGCGEAIGDWAYSRLEAAGWPDDSRAPDIVIGELCGPLLFSACLRSLRRVGRSDLIEREIARSRRPWCVMKCVVECMRSGYAGVDDAQRLRSGIEESAVSIDGRIQNLIEEIASNRRGHIEVGQEPVERQTVAPTVLSFPEAVGLLMTDFGSHDFDDKSTVVLEDITEEELWRLVELADPSMERERGVEVYVPEISFRDYGHTVATRHVTYGAEGETVGAWIRPAIAAANVYQARIRWHDELLGGLDAERYVRRVIDCVIESGNVEPLYDLLSRDAGQFLQILGASVTGSQLSELIDERVVPILCAYVSAGTDEMLESLARVARSVLSADIDRVLVLLWKRWIGEFGGREEDMVTMQNHHYWRAFRELTDHPRFGQIKDWHKDLAPLLYSRGLDWFGKDNVVRVLARDRRSYAHLEIVLFRARDWEHCYADEIELLDRACERLFSETD